MSLQSDFELSQDAGFRAKVIIAASKVAMDTINAATSTERQKSMAREVLKNIHHYAERLYIIVASQGNVDTSSNDRIIETAVKNGIVAISEE